MSPGEDSEAYNSKRNYVKNRLRKVDESALLNIARRVCAEFSSYSLGEFIAQLDEEFEGIGVSEITRREILKTLDSIELFVELNTKSKLSSVFPDFVLKLQKEEELVEPFGGRYEVPIPAYCSRLERLTVLQRVSFICLSCSFLLA